MKIKGKTGLRDRTLDVTIGALEGGGLCVLTFRALPMGFAKKIDEDLGEVGPAPILAGGGVMRGEDGVPLTDELGQRIPKRNPKDPAWLKKKRDHLEAYSMALFAVSLDPKSDVEFETDRKAFNGDGVGYHLALKKELEDFGFTPASFKTISDAIAILAGPLTEDEIDEARLELGVSTEAMADAEGN